MGRCREPHGSLQRGANTCSAGTAGGSRAEPASSGWSFDFSDAMSIGLAGVSPPVVTIRLVMAWVGRNVDEQDREAVERIVRYVLTNPGDVIENLRILGGSVIDSAMQGVSGDDLAQLNRRILVVQYVLVGVLAAGIVWGFLKSIYEAIEGVIDIVGDLEGFIDDSLELLEAILSPEGRDVCREMGRQIGGSSAARLREIATENYFYSAFHLGAIIGPFVVGVILAYFTAGTGTAAVASARFGQILAKLRRLPKASRVLRRLKDRMRLKRRPGGSSMSIDDEIDKVTKAAKKPGGGAPASSGPAPKASPPAKPPSALPPKQPPSGPSGPTKVPDEPPPKQPSKMLESGAKTKVRENIRNDKAIATDPNSKLGKTLKKFRDPNDPTGQQAKRVARRLNEVKKEKDMLDFMDNEVASGRATRRVDATGQSIWEYPDGSVVRHKPGGDAFSGGKPTYSVEVLKDGKLQAQKPKDIAFKVDGEGNAVPKNPADAQPHAHPSAHGKGNPYPNPSTEHSQYDSEMMNAGHKHLER